MLIVVAVMPIGDYRPKACLCTALLLLLAGTLCGIARLKVAMRQKLEIGAVALVAYVLVVFWMLSSLSCWCCLRAAPLEAMCELAGTTADLLTAHGIPYWVCWGTLLGAVREAQHPLQVVPWEHDFDFCVHESDWPRVVAAMSGEDASQRGISFDTKALNVYHKSVKLVLARVYVDFFRFFPSPDNRCGGGEEKSRF